MLQHHSIPIKTMEAMDTTADIPIIAAEEDAVCKAERIGAVDEAHRAIVIYHNIFGLT